MAKIKSSLGNMTAVLAGLAVIVGALLAMVNHVTAEPIRQKAEKTLAAGIKAVMQSDDIGKVMADTLKTTVDGKEAAFVIHNVSSVDGREIGAAVESTTLGFGGDIKVLVGFNSQGEILGYTILQHSETPGLGAKASTWFQGAGKGSVIGLNPAKKPLAVKKDGGDVDAITASTITSRAFLKAINQAYTAYANDKH